MQYNISFSYNHWTGYSSRVKPFVKKRKSYSSRVLLPTKIPIIRFNSITCPLRFELGSLINGLMRRHERRDKLALRRQKAHKEALDLGVGKKTNQTESNRTNRTKTDSNRTKIYFKPFG